MPSVSKKQQRFFGIIRAIKKGVFKGKKTPEIQRAASSISDKDSKKMASTKHKGLPEKVKEELNTDDKPFVKKLVGKLRKGSKTHAKQADDLEKAMNEDYVKELEDGLVKMDYPSYDEVDKLMCKIAKENDIDTTTLHMAFKTKHLMVPDDWAKKKMMEPVMIPKTPKITGDVKEGVTAKQRFKRDAGKIAKAVMKQKEHEKYVNFLPVGEAVNAAQQAAIAISKRERLQDLKVAKKRKLKKEDYEPVITEKCWKGYEKKGMKTMFGKRYPNCVKKKRTNESVETINELSQDTMASAAQKAMQKRDAARGTPEYGRRQKQVVKFVSGAVKKRQQRDRAENSFSMPAAERTPTMEEVVTEDDMKGMSVKSGHKRPTKSGAGMTAKGVAAYRRRNPGSKLKTAVTGKVKKGSKDAKRRKSYCARSAGQMKKFPKAAKDPNSRLRQARRRWKC